MRPLLLVLLALPACLPEPSGSFDTEVYGPAFSLDDQTPDASWQVDLEVTVAELGSDHTWTGQVTVLMQAVQSSGRTGAADGSIESTLTADAAATTLLSSASFPFSSVGDVGTWSLPVPDLLSACVPGERCAHTVYVHTQRVDDAVYDGEWSLRVLLDATDTQIEHSSAVATIIPL